MSDSNNDGERPPLTFVGAMLGIMTVLIVAAVVDGAFPKRLLRIFPSPIVMFLLVVVISLIALAVNPNDGIFVAVTLDTIDADILQALYLPPLLFSDVMRMNLRVFKKSFWQVNWLVFPGVIAGAGLTALFPLYLMPSGPPFFSTYESLAFGSAMSTTDPIAVLMILNDVGAPKRLAALVGGESLLNDASSIVLLTLFLELQAGANLTGGDIVRFCFQEVLVGPCIGLLGGIITLLLMKRVEQNVVALVTLSFAMPYLSFAVCIFYLETSGVLAVITLGLVLNRFGHAFLSKDMHAVEGFWDQVEFYAVMTLYTQVGIFVASDFLQGSITGTDWGSLFLFFLYILLVRLIIVVVSFPILARTGYGLSWREAIVVWHAGLRGAVGILLSLSIKNAPGVSTRTGSLVLFLTAGVVVLMLFNVATTKPLCNFLGIRFDPSNKVFLQMRDRIDENTLHTLMCTGMTEDVARHGIGFAREPDSLLAMNLAKTKIREDEGEEEKSIPGFGHDNDPHGLDEHLLASKRQHLCAAFRATFHGLQEKELIPRTAWFLLVRACERRVDMVPVTNLLRLDDVVVSGGYFHVASRLALALGRAFFIRSHENLLRVKEVLLNRFDATDIEKKEDNEDLFGLVEILTYCAFGILIAHQRGRRLVNEIFAVFSDESENLSPNETRTRHPGEVKRILEESEQDCKRPAELINFVFSKFPRVIERIKKAHTIAQVHDKNIQVLGGMKRAGFVQGVALKQLLVEVERLDKCVEKLDFPVLPPTNIGESGNDITKNPNFGPFASHLRQVKLPVATSVTSPKRRLSKLASKGADGLQEPSKKQSSARFGMNSSNSSRLMAMESTLHPEQALISRNPSEQRLPVQSIPSSSQLQAYNMESKTSFSPSQLDTDASRFDDESVENRRKEETIEPVESDEFDNDQGMDQVVQEADKLVQKEGEVEQMESPAEEQPSSTSQDEEEEEEVEENVLPSKSELDKVLDKIDENVDEKDIHEDDDSS